MSKTEYKGVLHKELNKISSINYRFHRVSSMLLDHIIMTIVLVPPLILLMILMTSKVVEFNDNVLDLGFYFVMFLYINKDFFRAKSPAKRFLGYQVVDNKTEAPASEFQCFVRNLTLAIGWPLEVIVGLINPQRRIGDYIANTKVIKAEKEILKLILIDFKKQQLKLNYIFILMIGVIYFYVINMIFNRI